MSTDWMPAPDAEPESFDATVDLFGDATGMADLFAEETAGTATSTPEEAPEAKAEEAKSEETPDAEAEAAPAAEAASDDATVPDTTEEAGTQAAADGDDPLAAEQAEWGELWDVRGRAKGILAAFTTGTEAELLAELEAASPVKADRVKRTILETSALQHVAEKYGLDPELVAARLQDQEPVSIPESLEAVLDAMPDEQADIVRKVLQQHTELAARAKTAEETLQQKDAAAQAEAQARVETEFRNDLLRMRQTNVLELAGANKDPKLLGSIDDAAYAAFLKDPKVEKAFDDLETAITEQQSEDLQRIQSDKLNRLFRSHVLEELSVRGMKPVAPSKSKTAPPPAAAAETKTVTTKTQQKPTPEVKEPVKAAGATAGGDKLPKVYSVAEILEELTA